MYLGLLRAMYWRFQGWDVAGIKVGLSRLKRNNHCASSQRGALERVSSRV
jgi:hypothetical protein